MANKHTEFWLALLNHSQDRDQRVRLWNCYLEWKLPPKIKEKIDPEGGCPQWNGERPAGSWPELTEEERRVIEMLATRHGGQPEFSGNYMDFSHLTLSYLIDLSGLILVAANFENTRFQKEVFFQQRRFYEKAWFPQVIFEGKFLCQVACFDCAVSFDGACFERGADFVRTHFKGGASFNNVVFNGDAQFAESRFEKTICR